MKSELINQIYADVSQSKEYQKSEEMKQLTKIQDEQGKAIRKTVGDRMYINNIDGFVSASEAGCERYGFILGFKYAMRLMQECFNPTGQNI